MNERNDVMKSILKLMRAMRRQPRRKERSFPPAVERMLMNLRLQEGISPAELCERFDVRPSSMSELLGHMEKDGLIRRESNDDDKRATKVFLSDAGQDAVKRIEEKFNARNTEITACFNDEELAQFCTLCDRLSAHLESLNGDDESHHEHHGHHHGFECRGMHHPHGRCGHHGPHRPCPDKDKEDSVSE